MSDLALSPPSVDPIETGPHVGYDFNFKDSTTTVVDTPGSHFWQASSGNTLTPLGNSVLFSSASVSNWLTLGNSTAEGTAFDGSLWPIVRIRLRPIVHDPAATWRGWFFWSTDAHFTGEPGSSDWPYDLPNSSGYLNFSEPDWTIGEWREIVIEPTSPTVDPPTYKAWEGETITHMRFDFYGADPLLGNEDFEIDYVRVERPRNATPQRIESVPNSRFDVLPDSANSWRYAETETLETAIRLSLFCDARAEEGDELPEGDGSFGEDLRGWWGSKFLSDGAELGSRLWTLRRSKLTSETRQRARDYTLAALEWIVDLGIARSIEVETSVAGRGVLEIAVVVHREADTPARFAFLWEAL